MIRTLTERYLARPYHRGKGVVLRPLFARLDGQPLATAYGVTMRCDSGDRTNFFALSGKADVNYADVYDEVRALTSGMAFIDIGANAGLFSMVACDRLGDSGPVIAIEPVFETFARLVDNARLNAATNFFPFHAAIGPSRTMTRFIVARDHSGKAHCDPAGTRGVIQLPFTDLEPAIREIVGDRPTLVKIDVEGAEHAVLRSMAGFLRDGPVVRLIVEVDGAYLARADSSAGDLYATMADAGFVPRHGAGHRRRHFNEVFSRAPAAG